MFIVVVVSERESERERKQARGGGEVLGGSARGDRSMGGWMDKDLAQSNGGIGYRLRK